MKNKLIAIGLMFCLFLTPILAQEEFKEITEYRLNPIDYLSYKLSGASADLIKPTKSVGQPFSVIDAELPAGKSVNYGDILDAYVTMDWKQSTSTTKIAIYILVITPENKEIDIFIKDAINEKEREKDDVAKLRISGIATSLIPNEYIDKDNKYELLFIQYIRVLGYWKIHGETKSIPFGIIDQNTCSGDETKCISEFYFTCENGLFKNHGKVEGKCGVISDDDQNDIDDDKCYEIDSNMCKEIECPQDCLRLGDCYVTLDGCKSKLINTPGCPAMDYVCYDDNDDGIREIWVRGTCSKLLNKYADCEFGCQYVNDRAECKDSPDEEEEEDSKDVECTEFYWFDDLNLECKYSEFCGKVREGIYSFNTLSECKSELYKILEEKGCEEDKDCETGEICVDKECVEEEEIEELSFFELIIFWFKTIFGLV